MDYIAAKGLNPGFVASIREILFSPWSGAKRVMLKADKPKNFIEL